MVSVELLPAHCACAATSMTLSGEQTRHQPCGAVADMRLPWVRVLVTVLTPCGVAGSTSYKALWQKPCGEGSQLLSVLGMGCCRVPASAFVFRTRAPLASRVVLPTALATLLSQSALAGALTTSPARSAVTRHPHKPHHKQKKRVKASGPSLTLVGFGLNQQFIKPSAKVSDRATCAAIIGSGAPGENVRFTILLRATAIPSNAPTTMQQMIPWDGGVFNEGPGTTKPVPWSGVFGPGTQSVNYSGSTKQIFQTGTSTSFTEGVSGSDIDGTYSFSISVPVGPHMLSAQGSILIAC